jgi:alkylated DNA nucleotide flippase Atl1
MVGTITAGQFAIYGDIKKAIGMSQEMCQEFSPG